VTLSGFPYPGGKTVYCNDIIYRMPEHRRYVEPFGGPAATSLRATAGTATWRSPKDGSYPDGLTDGGTDPEEASI